VVALHAGGSTYEISRDGRVEFFLWAFPAWAAVGLAGWSLTSGRRSALLTRAAGGRWLLGGALRLVFADIVFEHHPVVETVLLGIVMVGGALGITGLGASEISWAYDPLWRSRSHGASRAEEDRTPSDAGAPGA
jgi:hypothetical protein